MADVLVLLGAALLALLLLQGLLALYGALRITTFRGRREGLAIDLMSQRVEAARRQGVSRDSSELSWSGYRKFEIVRRVDEGGDICSFHLVPHDRKQIPSYRPGQYLMFELHIPGVSKPTIRCYSLSDCPKDEGYRVSIKRIPPPRDKPDAPPGLASGYFHDHVHEGDILDVKAPSGHFFLDTASDAPVVLIGGGVGITPVLSMLNAIAGAESPREAWFFYGVRHRDEHIQADHLRQMARDNDHIHLHVCYSEPREGVDEAERDYHHAGHVSVELFKRILPSNNYDFYLCGPPPMMSAITGDLDEWGVPKNRVHYETFGPASVKELRKPEPADDAIATEVTFDRSGTTCSWDPAKGTLLELAEEYGVVIDFGCRAGNCGTCLTAIRSGEVEYTTEPGADAEDGSCLACICVPKGPLVLDA